MAVGAVALASAAAFVSLSLTALLLVFIAPSHALHLDLSAVPKRPISAPSQHFCMMSSSSSPPPSTAVASASRKLGLFTRTPLLPSAPLSNLCNNRPVYLKLDTLQSSGSFKDRGMAHLCETFQTTKGTRKLISSSGGNAGLAVATVAPRLGMEVSVIVPETTKTMVVDKLKRLGADVTVHGKNWNEADTLARRRVEEDMEAEYVSPYDHPLLWTGHSTVVDEIVEQLNEQKGAAASDGVEPAMIIASVGGGGLICGLFEGLERNGLSKTTVVAAETDGAASFGKAFVSGTKVRLESIDSIATSLGALEVTDVALDRARRHQDNGGSVKAAMCTDAEAVEACVRFAEDHRVLVEPACGAALAALYSDRLRKDVLEDVPEGPIVVEVCGGSGVNVELLSMWKKEFLG
mmetsp:Transcript_14208/g.28660  ORF Transcript_14208/g.28660 Transcript_14208/m.28660 type:complete len:406 (+) Transcript_14208:57-1274(+)|eukprot:CAMPEP_0178690176 /NCGR_PEP_ID=MMETSP0699-20121125/5928_1 /TAXON_ID=265572 /ORGANISM="Extubocellulus spinifer, Strain CCMP396" /LENGTH=405 /DNA_ID=CAMNT_0020335281 /DNA_START=49 /DNA_END=1266 /DNA_ORIENTATION=+